MTNESTKMQMFEQQEMRTRESGHDTINRVITEMRKLADGLEHYREAYDRAMCTHDYSAAKDHLQATHRVLAELVDDASSKLTMAADEVETTNDLRHDAQIEMIKAKMAQRKQA